MFALFGFLLTIGILVVVHEFGHYIFARIFKVKVISFSIGFGPKLLKWNSKHNEWCISAIPLGGYVKMLDEREAAVPHHLKQFAYNNKPPYQKLLIAFAGPLFNILFAFIAYYCLGLYGIYTLKPVIESIRPIAIVKNIDVIKPNSTILSINNTAVSSWSDADKVFAKEINRTTLLNFTLKNESGSKNYAFNLTKYKDNIDDYDSLTSLGLYPIKYQTTVSYVEPQSVADVAGVKESDTILKINNQSMTNWFALSDTIRNNPSKKLDFEIKRNNQIMHINLVPDSISDDNGQIIGKIGIMPTLDTTNMYANSYIKKYTILSSFGYALDSSVYIFKSNITMVTMMLQGKMSWHNVGGPVTIAKASEGALHQGIKAFVDLLALISLSIAFMNLLPIPVLDGGHIVIYAIEWLIGKQINNNVQQLIFTVGLFIVLAISSLALYNDFIKIFNW